VGSVLAATMTRSELMPFDGLGPLTTLVPVADRGGGDAGEVGTGAGLGHRDGGDQLASGIPATIAALARRCVLDEVRRGDVVVECQPEARSADTRGSELLADDRVEPEVVRAAAPVLLGDRHAEEPVLPGREIQLARGDAGSLPLEIVGRCLLGHEGGEGLAERVVFVVEDRAHPRSVGSRARRVHGSAPAGRVGFARLAAVRREPTCIQLK
jgi:hypothetical protein